MQEITIIVMIDTQAATEANSLEGNIYLIDNLRTEGSTGEGTPNIKSKVNSLHWIDGSQSGEYLFNWLPYPIASVSPMLPKTYAKTVAKRHDALNLKLLQGVAGGATKDKANNLTALATSIGKNVSIRNAFGAINETGTKLMGLDGTIITHGQNDPVNEITHLVPQITNLTGEAIEQGVIYPAQYGTPVQIKDGWYWSASTDGSKVGTYSYTMHITLYKPVLKGKEIIWEPMYFTHDAKIEITTAPMLNGFTKEGCAYLPII
jgi:hypothetical protein